MFSSDWKRKGKGKSETEVGLTLQVDEQTGINPKYQGDLEERNSLQNQRIPKKHLMKMATIIQQLNRHQQLWKGQHL